MNTPTPDDLTEAVEAAADALRRQSRDDWWTLNTGHDWDHERAIASVAVEAAAPLIEGRLIQVGWLGPYGLIPGGMDNDPAPHWRPVYVRREDGDDRG